MPVRIHKKEYKRPKYNYTCLCLLDLYHTLIPTALNLNCSLSRTSRPTPFTCLPKSKYKCFNSTTHSRLQPPPHRKNLNINALTAPHTHACSSSSLKGRSLAVAPWPSSSLSSPLLLLLLLLLRLLPWLRLGLSLLCARQNYNAFNICVYWQDFLSVSLQSFHGSAWLHVARYVVSTWTRKTQTCI